MIVLLSLAGCECRPECWKKKQLLHWNRSAPAVVCQYVWSTALTANIIQQTTICCAVVSRRVHTERAVLVGALSAHNVLSVCTRLLRCTISERKGPSCIDPWAGRSDPGLGSTAPSPKILIGLVHILVHGSQLEFIHQAGKFMDPTVAISPSIHAAGWRIYCEEIITQKLFIVTAVFILGQWKLCVLDMNRYGNKSGISWEWIFVNEENMVKCTERRIILT